MTNAFFVRKQFKIEEMLCKCASENDDWHLLYSQVYTNSVKPTCNSVIGVGLCL